MQNIVGALLLLAQAATAANPPPKAVSDDQKIICRLVTEAESRIPFRVCRTKADWEKIAKDNQEDWRSSRNDRRTACNSANC